MKTSIKETKQWRKWLFREPIVARGPREPGRLRLVNANGIRFGWTGDTVTADQQLYHASCGDRFEWVPPHELALRLKII